MTSATRVPLGRKRKHFATANKTSTQVAASGRDWLSISKERKQQVVDMFQSRFGAQYKRNSLAKFIDELLKPRVSFKGISKHA